MRAAIERENKLQSPKEGGACVRQSVILTRDFVNPVILWMPVYCM